MKWEDPPPDARFTRRHEPWEQVAQRLRDDPLRWAVVAEGANPSLVTKIRKGQILAFQPAGHFDATSRGTRTKDVKIYARYIGEKEA